MLYLALGSNLGDRHLNLQLAVGMIAYRIGPIKCISSLVETPAMDFEGGDFYNACLGVETALPPEEVLNILLEIEVFLGRKKRKGDGYQSRAIDLDLLLYDEFILSSDVLSIPHPRMLDRNFVLAPLAEIASNHIHPLAKKNIRELYQNCTDQTEALVVAPKLFPVKPVKYFAIEGNIGAGKTTFAKQLNKALGGSLLLENFYDNPYLEDFYRDPLTFALAVENAFLTERIHQQTNFFEEDPSLPVIADYCLEKSPLFARQNLTKEDFDTYMQGHRDQVKTLPQPEVIFYLEQSIVQLQKNIKKRGRPFEQNMDNAYLEKIERGYQQWQKESALVCVNFPLHGQDILQTPEVFYRFLLAVFRL